MEQMLCLSTAFTFSLLRDPMHVLQDSKKTMLPVVSQIIKYFISRSDINVTFINMSEAMV